MPGLLHMTLAEEDVSILDKFAFDVPPVGVKFLAKRPDKVERSAPKRWLSAKCSRGPRKGMPFMLTRRIMPVMPDLYVLGQAEVPAPFVSGEFGAGSANLRGASFC